MRLTEKRIRLTAAVLALLLAVALATGWGAAAKTAFPTATERFFINDFADVLTDADEQTVYEAGVKLYTATKAQVVLVTVNSLGGRALEDYGIGLAREWGIGDAELDNGILLLFTTDGPHSRVEVGSGLEGALPDSKAGRILDTFLVPWYEDRAAWSASLTETYKALVNVTYDEYGMTEEQYALSEEIPEDEDGWDILLLIGLFLAFLAIRAFIVYRHPWTAVFLGGRGFFGGAGGSSGGGGGGFSGGGGGFSGGGASR